MGHPLSKSFVVYVCDNPFEFHIDSFDAVAKFLFVDVLGHGITNKRRFVIAKAFKWQTWCILGAFQCFGVPVRVEDDTTSKLYCACRDISRGVNVRIEHHACHRGDS